MSDRPLAFDISITGRDNLEKQKSQEKGWKGKLTVSISFADAQRFSASVTSLGETIDATMVDALAKVDLILVELRKTIATEMARLAPVSTGPIDPSLRRDDARSAVGRLPS